MRVLLTGGTGFIGSHLAGTLSEKGHQLLLTRRSSSPTGNCSSFQDRVSWIDTEDGKWVNQACNFNPEIIIHAAWNGVTATDRDNRESQLSNIDLMNQLLYITEKCSSKKLIALGSQAEYGLFSTPVTETVPANPISNYGMVKLAVLHQLSSFCQLRNISWYWLRIFSIIGEHERESWFIPSLITTILSGKKEMDLTPGEQEYAYLYVDDLTEAVSRMIEQEGASGIYNLSSSRPLKLKYVAETIKNNLNPDFKLNFGAVAYRENQPLFVAGNSEKFIREYGAFEHYPFEEAVKRVISHFKTKK